MLAWGLVYIQEDGQDLAGRLLGLAILSESQTERGQEKCC